MIKILLLLLLLGNSDSINQTNKIKQNDNVDKGHFPWIMPYNLSLLNCSIVPLSHSCHCDPCRWSSYSLALCMSISWALGLCYSIDYMGIILQTPLAWIPTWQERCILVIQNIIYLNLIITNQCRRQSWFWMSAMQCFIWPLTCQLRRCCWIEDVAVVVWCC